MENVAANVTTLANELSRVVGRLLCAPKMSVYSYINITKPVMELVLGCTDTLLTELIKSGLAQSVLSNLAIANLLAIAPILLRIAEYNVEGKRAITTAAAFGDFVNIAIKHPHQSLARVIQTLVMTDDIDVQCMVINTGGLHVILQTG